MHLDSAQTDAYSVRWTMSKVALFGCNRSRNTRDVFRTWSFLRFCVRTATATPTGSASGTGTVAVALPRWRLFDTWHHLHAVARALTAQRVLLKSLAQEVRAHPVLLPQQLPLQVEGLGLELGLGLGLGLRLG